MNNLDKNPPTGYEPTVNYDTIKDELQRLFDMLDEDLDELLSKEEISKLL
jgi:hypothetical protein